MWTCPKCETNNDGDACIICGTPKPLEDAGKLPRGFSSSSDNQNVVQESILSPANHKLKKGSKWGTTIFLVSSLLAAVLVICLCNAGHITGLSLNSSSLSMHVGDIAKLDCRTTRFLQASGTEPVQWNYDNAVVSVDADGTVHAVGEGDITIEAVSADSSHRAYCSVHVEYPEITVGGKSFKVNVDTLDLSGCNITDLSPLTSCVCLGTLNISNNPTQDVSALASIPTLKDVNLNNTDVADITPLSMLPNLTMVHLANTHVQDISSLNPSVYIDMDSQAFSASISLNLGQTYNFTNSDFGLITGTREIDWTTGDPAVGSVNGGVITATGIQADLSQSALNTTVTGTIENSNISFVYGLSVNCTVYSITSKKVNLMNCYDYPLVFSPKIENCYGFTVKFSSTASHGNPYKVKWHVMVKMNNGKWVSVKTITVKSGVEQTIDIVFDKPTGFYQITVLPNGRSVPNCEWGASIEISNLRFLKN